MKKIKKIMAFLLVLASLSACTGSIPSNSTGESSRERTQEATTEEKRSVSVETYKNTFTFDKIPERVVSLSFSETQLLVALGLGDRIVGIATAETGVQDCLPEYQKELSKLKVISKDTPSMEVLLESNPDFVVGTVYSFTEHGVAPAEDFVKQGIPYYALRGTYVENANIQDTYKDIENLAKIFHVEERGEKLIQSLKEREAKYMESAPKDHSTKVFVYNSGDEKQAMTVGGNCLDAKLLQLAGGETIFKDIEKRYGSVSWEEVSIRNPELIVIYDYNDGVTRGTLEEKIKEIKEHPAMADVDAVKNNRFVSVRLIEVFPGLQLFDAVEKIQQGIIQARGE